MFLEFGSADAKIEAISVVYNKKTDDFAGL